MARPSRSYKRALEARERVLGREHPHTLTSVNNLAVLYFAQRDWTRAAQFWRRSTAAIAARTQRGAAGAGQAVTGKKKTEAKQSSWQFWGAYQGRYTVSRQKAAAPMRQPRARCF